MAAETDCERRLRDQNKIDDAVAFTEAQLAARPSKTPDFEAESDALIDLADSLANQPSMVLQQLCERLMALCGADSAGVDLLNSHQLDAGFCWPAIAGGGRPFDTSLCKEVVDRDRALLYHDLHEIFPAADAGTSPITEIMLAPFHQGGAPIGAVWILSHDPNRRFDREDLRLLTRLARFAAAAYAVSRSEAAAGEVRDRLELTLANAQIVGLYEWDVASNLVFADARFAELYSVDPAQAAAGAPIEFFFEGIHPGDRERVGMEIEATLQTGAPFASEYRLIHRHGPIRHVLARGVIQRDPQGAPRRFSGVVVDLTEQRAAEGALFRAQDRYRALFQWIDSGFCVVEVLFDKDLQPVDYRFVEANPAFEKLTGLVGPTGKTIRELVPTIEQHWLETYGQVAKTGEPARFENRATALSDRWFDVHAYRVGAPRDHQVAILFNDITDRRRMEQALRDSEQQFRSLAQAMPNHVWTADLAGQLDWFNDQVYAYSGADKGDLNGDRWASLLHPDDLTGAAAAWAYAVETGENYQVEFRLRRRDGAYHWHIARAVRLRDSKGEALRWVGTNTNIQEQKETAETLIDLNLRLEQRVEERSRALRDSEDFTRLALSAVSGVGVWTYDVIADRFYCDAAISELYGLDPVAGAAGLPAASFLANVLPEDRAALSATMTGGMRRSGDLELEYRLRHSDGSVHWVLSRGHTYFEDGKPVRRTGVGVETTRLRLLEEQLRQSQKMEAVGQLTGGIAHDFNNMLTGVLGSLDLIQHRMAKGRTDGIDRFMNAAITSAQRAAGLTHRLLAFARRQTLDTRTHDIAGLVDGMTDMLRRVLGENVRLETRFGENLWLTLTDANQFENALLNLAINARDAMPDGGPLLIEARNASIDEVYAKAHGEVGAGEYVAVAVSDTGAGMPPDVIARAFDPFFTTKPVGQGTGLGLSMIYGFVQQTGGHVQIESKPGSGTTVTLFLPRSEQDEEIVHHSALTPAPRGEGQSILIVEDEPAVRLLMTEVVKELGYQIAEAADGYAALKLIDSWLPVDLLITDVGLPVMNGRQLAEIVRDRRPGLKVLFMTGYAENAARRSDFLEAGMDMMMKPFALGAFAERVSALLAAEPA